MLAACLPLVALAGGGNAATSARELSSLPNVRNLDFQDVDLDPDQIHGTVTWDPPDTVDFVVGYRVYYADSVSSRSGPTARRLVAEVAVGTNLVNIPADTQLSPFTHVWVHSRSTIGENPGTSIPLCDVTTQDTLQVTNGAQTVRDWGIHNLEFYHSVDCSGDPVRFVDYFAGSPDGNYQHKSDSHPNFGGDHSAGKAFDNDPPWQTGSTTQTPGDKSYWRADCTGACAPGDASLGIIGVCQPEEVRCVKIFQCITPGEQVASSAAPCGSCNPEAPTLFTSGSSTLCTYPAPKTGNMGVAGRTKIINLLIRGKFQQAWLLAPDGEGADQYNYGNLMDGEYLLVSGRRRRAAYVVSAAPQCSTYSTSSSCPKDCVWMSNACQEPIETNTNMQFTR